MELFLLQVYRENVDQMFCLLPMVFQLEKWKICNEERESVKNQIESKKKEYQLSYHVWTSCHGF